MRLLQRLAKALALFCLLAGSLRADPPPQAQISFTPGLYDSWNADWDGESGRTYFMQWSLDLKNWHFAPVLEYGVGLKTCSFNSTSVKFFVRLEYTDTPTADAENDDFDGDGLSNIDQVMIYDTDPLNPDTDGDGLPDGWEVSNGLDPRNDGSLNPDEGGLGDSDHDGLSNLEEWVNNTLPWEADIDGDGMSDGWEVLYGLDPLNDSDGTLDSDGDGLSSYMEFLLKLNPSSTDSNANGILDGNEDFDKDGLKNLEEIVMYGTDPRNPDSDGDGMPDGWEVLYGLIPTDATGDNGTEGDIDHDEVSNFDEWLNGTSPVDADTDHDGRPDKPEIDSGGNPVDAGDGGNPPPAEKMLEVPFKVGDPSGSHSEKWIMTITGKGPNDHRTFSLAAADFGVEAEKTFKLRKWNKYEVVINHLSTDPDYLADYGDQPDYDWDGTVGGLPTSESHEEGATGGAANNFFMVADHWLVDNRTAILTTERQGDDSDLASGKKAFLVPVAIRDNIEATGVDKDSVTVGPSETGYQNKFWIMAPAGGAAYTDDTLYKVALDSPTTLTMACDNAEPNPSSLSTFGSGEPMVSWRGTTAATSDNTPSFNIGSASEVVDLPIRVKTMEKRTVTVAVHSIASVVSGRADDPPDLLPTAAAIKEKLDVIFGYQLNAYFEVRMVTPEAIPFDTADPTTYPGFTFDLLKPAPFPGDRMLCFRSWQAPEVSSITANRVGNDDIHVFVIGGATPMINYGLLTGSSTILTIKEVFVGQANTFGENYCIVDGDRDRSDFDQETNTKTFYYPDPVRTTESVADTIAHEIGHIIVGSGHPNEGGGDAPLFGTDRTRRLMCSGTERAIDAHLLVKSEWDHAKTWLNAVPDKRYRNQHGLSDETPTGNY